MANGNTPATKQDVIEAVNASEERLTKVMQGMTEASEERLTKVMQGMTEASEERLTKVMQGMIQASEERLRTEMGAREDRLVETMRDIQTEMLKAFYSLIESNQKRFAEIETEGAAIKSRLATIEDRLLNLERKVNTPKPPQQ